MPTIEFKTNLHSFKTESAWHFHPNFFDGKDLTGTPKTNPVPNEPGVYIVGVKIPVSDPPQFDVNGKQLIAPNNDRFCPLYVGTHKISLRSRLKGHWDKDNKDSIVGTLNSFKELFDLNLSPNQFFKGIEVWNKKWKYKRNTDNNLRIMCNEINHKGHKSLIWFPNQLFFDIYLGSPSNNISPISNWHNNTVLKNDNYIKLSSTSLLKKIIDAKDRISNNYWYSYSVVDKDNINLLSEIEANVNVKLKGYGIWTYAYSKKNIKKNFDIDLTTIKDDLVNMTEKSFPLTSGNFII